MMYYSQQDLSNYSQTVERIAWMIENYYDDIAMINDKSPAAFYNYIKNFPYRRDPRGNEVVARPKHILNLMGKYGRDCKKCSIIVGSWAKYNGYPYRITVVSSRVNRKPHHVFSEVLFDGEWLNMDCTYSTMKFNDKKNHYTFRKSYIVVDRTPDKIIINELLGN